MSIVQNEVHQFWKRVRDNRQMTFSIQKETKALVGIQNSENEESKENRKRKRKNNEKKKEPEGISNTPKERTWDTNKMAKIKEKGDGSVNNANSIDDGGTWLC